jgi:hypothetical protein
MAAAARPTAYYLLQWPPITLHEEIGKVDQTRPELWKVVLTGPPPTPTLPIAPTKDALRHQRMCSMVTNFPLALAAMGATRPPKPWNSNLPACLHFKDTPLPRDPALNFVVTHMRLLISVGYKLSMPLDDHPGVVTDRVIMCFRPLLG